LSQFSKSNPGQLQQEPFKQPLNVQYGSYAVFKGNTALVRYLNQWLCTQQKSGVLASAYKSAEGVSNFPPMPSCS
jgi:polar amino acid transport system substrate-binding protein